MNATSSWLRKGELLYIATDEEDLSWFDPLREKFRVRFLRDFQDETVRLPASDRANLLGMIEQVVLSHGRTFTGTWFSTFSSYVCRLRAYFNDHHKKIGTRSAIDALVRKIRNDGILDSGDERWLRRSRVFPEESCYVYAPEQKRAEFQAWKMPQHAFYPREWPLAWENIDHLHGSTIRSNTHSTPGAESISSPLPLRHLVYKNFKYKEPIYPDEAVKEAKRRRQQEKAVNLAARDARE